MSLIIQTTIAGMFALKRKCPKCGRNQIVPASKRKSPVKCSKCGAEIPPVKK